MSDGTGSERPLWEQRWHPLRAEWVLYTAHRAVRPSDGRPTDDRPFYLEYHPPLRQPDTLRYWAGPEIGDGPMTNESDPDEKAAELQAVVVGRDGRTP